MNNILLSFMLAYI